MNRPRYAEGTGVPVERSKAELERLLTRHGASQRGIMEDDAIGRAIVMFTLEGRQYRIDVPLPTRKEFPEQRRREQRTRERWRALILMVKAKLELCALGVSTVEREFLADLVLPDGQRLHAALINGIRKAYETGSMPPLLPE